ncbi:hypothetical protein B4135_4012 [Caldibacillus debilis]|uniref:Uncharacterized protein n=1 Tax=Caldibacillus debilis TaxID=301148 RepID=A0A150L7K3_9BACI|nr:hypothetical protein B4135_4012 [Caldibacillus debilis]
MFSKARETGPGLKNPWPSLLGIPPGRDCPHPLQSFCLRSVAPAGPGSGLAHQRPEEM